MISNKDKVEQFKRDLKSLNFYKNKLISIDVELEGLAVRLAGVSSPSCIRAVIIENKRSPYDQTHIIELLMQEEQLINQRNMYVVYINSIEVRMKDIDSNVLKMCIDIYIKRKNHDYVAISNGYEHRQSMYRAIDKELVKKLQHATL